MIASIGVAALIFTNLVLLPVLLSYLGVSPKAAARSLRLETAPDAQRSRRGRCWSASPRGAGPLAQSPWEACSPLPVSR